MHVVGVVAAVATALVLLVAGVGKVAGPAAWRQQAAGMGVAAGVAAVVPFIELVLGALLLVQVQRQLVAWGAVALFAVFSAVLVLRLAQGQRPPCACFGSWSVRPIGPGHLLRNGVFIAVAVLAAVL